MAWNQQCDAPEGPKRDKLDPSPFLCRWVELGGLEVGENLHCETGTAVVTSTRTFSTSQTVYNIEVHGHHLYQIGESGVLVHNSCSSNSKDLAASLDKAGYPRPEGTITTKKGTRVEYEAAHIVPSGHKRGAVARAKLKKAEIDLNDVKNGFWAQRGHAGTHTNKFFDRLDELINADTPVSAVEGKLKQLWKEISSGEFRDVVTT